MSLTCKLANSDPICPPFQPIVFSPFFTNYSDGPTIVVINLMFRSFPTISDNKMVSSYFSKELVQSNQRILWRIFCETMSDLRKFLYLWVFESWWISWRTSCCLAIVLHLRSNSATRKNLRPKRRKRIKALSKSSSGSFSDIPIDKDNGLMWATNQDGLPQNGLLVYTKTAYSSRKILLAKLLV